MHAPDAAIPSGSDGGVRSARWGVEADELDLNPTVARAQEIVREIEAALANGERSQDEFELELLAEDVRPKLSRDEIWSYGTRWNRYWTIQGRTCTTTFRPSQASSGRSRSG